MRSFLFENLHFAIHLITALSFLAALWLHLDAHVRHRTWRGFFGVAGWFLLFVSFLISATRIESTLLSDSLFAEWAYKWFEPGIRCIGYALVAVWVWAIPIQKRLDHSKAIKPSIAKKPSEPVAQRRQVAPNPVEQTKERGDTPVVAILAAPLTIVKHSFAWLLPVLPFLIATAYLRRATTGIERHVRPMVYVFFGYTLYELLLLVRVWRVSTNPTLAQFSAPFGILWIITEVVLLVSSVLLIRWVARYLLRRLKTQLFMIFISIFLSAFVITAFVFSGLLLREVRSAMLERLEADAGVLALMIEDHRGAVTSDAQVLATQVSRELSLQGDEADLAMLARDFIFQKNRDVVIITDHEGKVLVRGDDPDKHGMSIADDSFIAAALQKNTLSGFTSKRVGFISVMQVRAAVPYDGGAILVGSTLDSIFLTGVREATGLDAAIFSKDILSASSLRGEDGIIGTRHSNKKVSETVLVRGESISGEVDLLGVSYLAAHLPIFNPDEEVVGMLFIGAPQVALIRTTVSSLQLTFVVVSLLMGLSIIPSAFFAWRISEQVR